MAARPLIGDEGMTWRTSGKSLGQFLRWNHHPDHPPLSFGLVRLSLETFGPTPWALRLPSMLAGILAIGVAWRLGRGLEAPSLNLARARSATTGLVLASLIAFDPVLLVQSSLARMYALLALCVLLTFDRLRALTDRDERRAGPWLLLGAILLAATWTHWMGYVLIPAVAAGALWPAGARSPGRLSRVLLALAPPSVGSLPPILHAARSWRVHGAAGIAGGNIGTGESTMGLAEAVRYTLWNAGHPWGLGPVGPAFVLLGLVGIAVLCRRSRPLAIGVSVTALVTLIATSYGVPERSFGVDRYLVPWWLAVAIGFASLPLLPALRKGVVVAAVVVCLAGVWAGAPRGLPSAFGVGTLAEAVAPEIGAGEAVALAPGYLQPIGEWYGLPVGLVPERWPRAEDGSRPPRAWLIGTASGSEAGPAPGLGVRRARYHPAGTRFQDLLARLEAVYGVPIDRVGLDAALRRWGAVAVAFTPDSATFRTPRRGCPSTTLGRTPPRGEAGC